MGKTTKTVWVGDLPIGGGHPVSVQSMCNTDTADIEKTAAQILELKEAGCELIRLAVPSEAAARAIAPLKEKTGALLVADIHFDYRLALLAADAGVDKIRLNPGNIGGEDRVKAVAEKCREKGIPIRIGVNGGSLPRELLEEHGGATPEAMVKSALYHSALLEKYDFTDIVISLKASDVRRTVEAYRLLSERVSYPLHLGVTEAGTYEQGILKSAVAMGSLLLGGIGDTVRVSLTEAPVREVSAGFAILKAAGIRQSGAELISCPTCGRCRVDLIAMAKTVEAALSGVKKNIKVAVMGCAVNGPGEAREADIGIAGGDGCVLLFKRGEVVRKIPEAEAAAELLKEIELL